MLVLAVVAFFSSSFIFAQDAWQLVFEDDAVTTDWKDRWFVDGKEALIHNTTEGLRYTSGKGENYHAGHTVLWTKQLFEDGVKIEYDFMRVDTCSHDAVLILYMLVEGRDEPPFKKDIHAWRELRDIPYMFIYWWGMKAAHISYATRLPGANDYIRSRAYPVTPGERNIDEILLEPSYNGEGLFAPLIWYHITAFKEKNSLVFTVEANGKKSTFTWESELYAPITHGRIGFRQMWGRESLYKNIRIYQKKKD